jgi:3-dehydroquinate synthase
MQSIKINLNKPTDNSYQIIIGNNILDKIILDLKKLSLASKYIIITDNNVKKLYGEKILDLFKKNKLPVNLIAVLPGEKSKSIERKIEIENKMFELGCGRDSCIVAFGGGIVGDLAGFTASTFNRGISFVQIPTTILSCADSSIGGKTGINTKYGKNLIGAFYQPKKVYIDTNFWQTLNAKEIKNGLAETVKHSLIIDKTFFYYLEKNYQKILDPNIAQYIAKKNCLIKKNIVEQDEKENGIRQILNYGHTIGHALENLSNNKISHGHAIAIGMNIAGKISNHLGFLSNDDLQKQNNLLVKVGLPIDIPKNIKFSDILDVIKLDKKAKNGEARFVLLNKIGQIKKQGNDYSFAV